MYVILVYVNFSIISLYHMYLPIVLCCKMYTQILKNELVIFIAHNFIRENVLTSKYYNKHFEERILFEIIHRETQILMFYTFWFLNNSHYVSNFFYLFLSVNYYDIINTGVSNFSFLNKLIYVK